MSATRSAVLFSVLAVQLEAYQGANKEATERTRATLLERSGKLLQLAQVLNVRVNKMDENNIQAQQLAIAEAYGQRIVESKRLNNSILSDFISAEMEKANEVFPLLEAIRAKTCEGK